MAKAKLICRVCGNEYESCKTRAVDNTFRWQDVSCSPECGAEYLRRIQESRCLKTEKADDNANTSAMYNEDVNGFDDEPDDEYISGFGDE